jgi:nitrite reductase/ring-hydroxylating ferredoxin subunit
MASYVLGRASELSPGERRIVEINGRSIGIFNVDGEFFALRNQCPHQGGALCTGPLLGLLESSCPGEYAYSRKQMFVQCPWHGWEFDLRTGQSYFDPSRTRVRPYPVEVILGRNVETLAAQDGSRLPGPYRAETFELSVDEDYLVLEMQV